MEISVATARLVAQLEKKIVECDNDNFALSLASWLARFLSANFCGIYHFKHIENLLAQRFSIEDLTRPVETDECLHVASEVYSYGGHTRLMRNLLVTSPKESRRVLLTRSGNVAQAAALLDLQPDHVHICRVQSERQKVTELARIFLKFRKVVLHIHPDDVVAAVALVLAKRVEPTLSVYFVNHSDHTFSVAVGQADFVMEISGYGWSLRGARDTESRSTFVGIPLNTPTQPNAPEIGFILTGGSSYKFRPAGQTGLPVAMKRILDREPTAHLLAIGPKTLDFWWWELKLRFPSRFIRQLRIPYSDYIQKFRICNVYVDSYPVTGGTAFTEALISGASVAGIHGGPNGYGVADALRSDSTTSFVEHTLSLIHQDKAELAKQSEVRSRAIEVHALASVHSRFDSIIKTQKLIQPPPELLCEKYDFDFRSEWRKKTTPFAAGFAGRQELALLPLLLRASATTLRSGIFAVQLIAKASVAAVRDVVSARGAQ